MVDLRQGKKIDDCYRTIHLYYQRDNLAYPTEVQLWCGRDYIFNLWSHRYVYKYQTLEIGQQLYQKYFVAKVFNRQGRLVYLCKTANEARRLPGTLEALRAVRVQIVILDSPEIYSEYAPYSYIENMKEFID